MKEAGFANFDVSSWFGLIAPAGTPPEVINKLNAAMVKALDKPEGAAQLRAAGRRGREDHAGRVRPVHQVGSGRLGPGGQGLGRQKVD